MQCFGPLQALLDIPSEDVLKVIIFDRGSYTIIRHIGGILAIQFSHAPPPPFFFSARSHWIKLVMRYGFDL